MTFSAYFLVGFSGLNLYLEECFITKIYLWNAQKKCHYATHLDPCLDPKWVLTHSLGTTELDCNY